LNSEHTEFEVVESEMQAYNTSAKKSVFDHKSIFNMPSFEKGFVTAKFPSYMNSCCNNKQFSIVPEESSIESSSTQMVKVSEMPDVARTTLNLKLIKCETDSVCSREHLSFLELLGFQSFAYTDPSIEPNLDFLTFQLSKSRAFDVVLGGLTEEQKEKLLHIDINKSLVELIAIRRL
jgi:hypothetical protein